MRRGSRAGRNVREAYRARVAEKMARASQVMAGHYARQLAELDAGGPVTVRGWQLAALVPDRPPGSAYRWYRLEVDGGVTEVVPVRRGPVIVGWEVAGDAA